MNDKDFANGVTPDVKLRIQPKICTSCGGKYIPTGNRQKLCPKCKSELKKNGEISDKFKDHLKACAPGPVTVSQIETPEMKMEKPEIPEAPVRIALPDGLAVVEEHAEILRRYYKGDLVDKNEFLAQIRERLEL